MRRKEEIPDDDGGGGEEEAIELPIDGTLDLHTFKPGDIAHLIPDYLDECRARDIYQVRIVHGKGTGSLRRSVHAILDRLGQVESYRLGGVGAGGWGATLVQLSSRRSSGIE